MAVRTTMATLIDHVRDLIDDDDDEGAPVFTNQHVQNALDQHRRDVKHLTLAALTTQAAGVVQWLDYYAPPFWAPEQGQSITYNNVSGQRLGNWEDDFVLRDKAWQIITPLTSDTLVGHWTFDVNADVGGMGKLPPVYLDGTVYNVYAAAAQLLRQWASKMTRSFDFVVGRRGAEMKRSDMHKMMLAQAAEFDGYAWPIQISMVRSDMQIGEDIGVRF